MTDTRQTGAGRSEWIGLSVLALASLVYAMDLTVLHLAVPSISADLDPTSSQLLWAIDIYGFMVAGLLITMGALGDRIGRRRLLMIGAAMFAAGSVAAALASSIEMLIVTRAVLGVAGATLAPSTLALIFNMFTDVRQRTVAIGVWAASFSAGAAVGPLAGGILLERFWWGSVFLMAVPVMALLLVVGPRVLPEFRDPDGGRFDPVGVIVSMVAVLGTIYGLKRAAEGELGATGVGAIVLGLLAARAFWHRLRTSTNPLLEAELFKNPAFTAALASNLLAVFIPAGFFLFIAQHFQLVLDFSPFESGLLSLPWALGFAVGAIAASRLVHRIPPGGLIAWAFVIAAGGLIGMAHAATSDGPLPLVIASVVTSLALSPIVTVTTELVVGSVPAEKAGAASGMSETGAELGGALGIAVLGAIGAAVYRRGLLSRLPEGLETDLAAPVLETLGAAVEFSAQVPGGLGLALARAAREAFIAGFELAGRVGAGILLGAAVVAGLLLRGVGPQQPGGEMLGGG